MKRTEVYDRLLETARSLFDRVEIGAGDFHGGPCVIRGERCLILNKSVGLDTNLKLVANTLADMNLDERYLLPAIRDAIERYSER